MHTYTRTQNSHGRARTISVSVGVPMHPPKEKPPINVVGDVNGRIAIMVVSVFIVLCIKL